MIDTWSTVGDFTAAVDGHELVKLRRWGSTAETPIPRAVRRASDTETLNATASEVPINALRWDFEMPAGTAAVSVGDAIVDNEGVRWTVQAVHHGDASTRTRCETQAFAIRFNLDDRVTVQQAVWQGVGQAQSVAAWIPIRVALPARIQLLDVAVNHLGSAASSVRRFKIILDDGLVLDHNHQLVDPRGFVYQVDRCVTSDQRTGPTVVEASAAS